MARLAGAGEVVARALVLCGTHRGLRGPEVLRLAWTDVDFAGDTMRVAERDVPLSAALDGALRAHANSSGPGALVPEVGRVFALGSASELRGVLFARCRAAGVWYGGRAWRALRAHAGVRFWDEYRDAGQDEGTAGKKALTASKRREATKHLVRTGIRQHRACELVERIGALAGQNPRWGCRRVHAAFLQQRQAAFFPGLPHP